MGGNEVDMMVFFGVYWDDEKQRVRVWFPAMIYVCLTVGETRGGIVGRTKYKSDFFGMEANAADDSLYR